MSMQASLHLLDMSGVQIVIWQEGTMYASSGHGVSCGCVWCPAIRMAMTPFPSTIPPGNAMAVNQGRHWAAQYMSRIQRMPSYMDMSQHVHALCPFLIAALPIAFCTRVSGKLRECALYLIEFAQMQMVLLSFNQIPCAFLIFYRDVPPTPFNSSRAA